VQVLLYESISEVKLCGVTTQITRHNDVIEQSFPYKPDGVAHHHLNHHHHTATFEKF
jgi:hypothetical protein